MPKSLAGATVHWRTWERWTLLSVLLAGGLTLAAMSASRWMTPRWLGLAVSTVGWVIFGLFNVGHALLLWSVCRRSPASRP